MSNNRVLLITDELGSGGAERQLTYLAIGLKNTGYDVRLFKCYPGDVFYATELKKAGIEAETINKAKLAIRRPLVLASIVKKWKPCAVIAYKDGTCIAACLAKLLTTFKLIVSERNTTQKLSLKERIKFQLYRMADFVVPNSYSQSSFIKIHAPWLTKKTDVITNMVDTTLFYSNGIKKNNQTKKIITIARINRQKNILKYLEAIKILKDRGYKVKFDWYGRPNQVDYFEQINARIKQLGINDLIKFHGHTTDVAELYRQADFFCLPSIYEGFPNVICEAMVSGLPIVCSDVCDNPFIVENEKNGFLFNPLEPLDIADKLETVLNMTEEEKQTMAQQNMTKITDLCSSKSFIKEYQKLLL